MDANTAQFWELPAGIGAAAVESAWNLVVEANESLRTTYSRVDSIDPRQRVGIHARASLPVIDASGWDLAPGWWTTLPPAQEPFDVGVEPPCRAAVVQREGGVTGLIAVFHHVAADDTGMRSAASQFRACLAGDTVQVPAQPLELAEAERGATRRHEMALAFWTQRWASFVPADRQGTDRTPRSQATLFSTRSQAAATAVSSRLGVSLQAVALSAGYLALFRTTGRSATTFGLMASNRFKRRWATMVTSMNQLAPLTAVDRPEQPAGEFVRLVYAGSMEAYSNAEYSVDALGEHLRAAGQPAPHPLEFDCYFNFLGDSPADFPPDHPAVTAISWERPRRQSGPAFHLAMSTGAGLTITLRASRSYLGTEGIPRMLGAMEAILLQLAADDTATLADLRPDPVRDLHGFSFDDGRLR
ncbi:condensation domain-containing protein [Actinoplanes derwentensis]|uniref:condensation domain-containing protein n=1 Tax=Actinoplanes derwentensis TaxID=113562 RepID=UPI0023B2C9BA|nr:condensation domain-containing protein [Actinoplanes derwentensis]